MGATYIRYSVYMTDPLTPRISPYGVVLSNFFGKPQFSVGFQNISSLLHSDVPL